jgi:hypothetical protein
MGAEGGGGPVRNRFFAGRLLSADDFAAETEYFRERLRRHNRALHGWGVVEGLEVSLDEDTGTLVISPGVAIDRNGEELIVECALQAPAPPPAAAARAVVELVFAERPFAPVLVGDGQEFTRIREGVEVCISEQPGHGVAIARLVWTGAGWSVDPDVAAPET